MLFLLELSVGLRHQSHSLKTLLFFYPSVATLSYFARWNEHGTTWVFYIKEIMKSHLNYSAYLYKEKYTHQVHLICLNKKNTQRKIHLRAKGHESPIRNCLTDSFKKVCMMTNYNQRILPFWSNAPDNSMKKGSSQQLLNLHPKQSRKAHLWQWYYFLSQRFLKFPAVFLTNAKISWPTE